MIDYWELREQLTVRKGNGNKKRAIDLICMGVQKDHKEAIKVATLLLMSDLDPWSLGVLAKIFRKSTRNPEAALMVAINNLYALVRSNPRMGNDQLRQHATALRRVAGTIALKGSSNEDFRQQIIFLRNEIPKTICSAPKDMRIITIRLDVIIEGKKIENRATLPH